jgi:hypothetical protein
MHALQALQNANYYYYNAFQEYLDQLGPTGGPQATSSPRPLVIRPTKLFVNLLLVTVSSFIFFTLNDLKKNCDSYLICCFA